MLPTTATARRALALVVAVIGSSAVTPVALARPHDGHRRGGAHRVACPPRACARLRVRLVTSRTVPARGTIGARAIVHGAQHGARVGFSLDGRRLGTDRRAPYALRTPATRVRPGRHRLRAVVLDGAGRRVAISRVLVVRPAPAGRRAATSTVAKATAATTSAPASTPTQAPASPPAPSPAPATPSSGGGTSRPGSWSDSFESGDFSGWSWWGQGQSDIWGHIAVIDPRSQGVPPLDGSKVARFETTPDDIAHGRTNAKLYRGFGSDLGTLTDSPPPDVSGTYSSWYYLPTTYHVPDHTWVNIFQFKEEYRKNGSKVSDPLWWVQLGPVHWASDMSQGYGGPALSGRSDAPVAFLNYPGNDWKQKRNFVPLPLGRWFQLTAVLRQGQSIQFFIDGKPLDTAQASTYPVSPFHGADSLAWTFGIGNYSTGANGPLYADEVSYAKAQ